MKKGNTVIINFERSTEFKKVLSERIDQYFSSKNISQSADIRMYRKTAAVLGWLVASYILLVFFSHGPISALLYATSLGLAAAGVGFNIPHDGGHRAYAKNRIVNRLAASAFDLLGASSYIWHWKHNVYHHGYTNLVGIDDDIDIGALGRLAPEQKRRWMHRFQQFYLWLLYGFLPFKWHFVDDFRALVSGRIGKQRFPRPKGLDLGILFGGKVQFFILAFVVPLFFHSIWNVLIFYGVASIILGVTLSVVFQLAHCVGEADFPEVFSKKKIGNEWAAHQVETTVNFCRDNRLIGWYLGGLNMQIEHHLFPKVCHVHYPAISRIVEGVCRDFNVRYTCHRNAFAALASHYRWLREMGRFNDVAA
jgi:linoleoyl-CoA desaturase